MEDTQHVLEQMLQKDAAAVPETPAIPEEKPEEQQTPEEKPAEIPEEQEKPAESEQAPEPVIPTGPDLSWAKELGVEPEKLKDEFIALRTKAQEYEARPKFEAATPEIEKFNRFVKETNIQDHSTFKKLNTIISKETHSQDDFVEALALKKLMDKPFLLEEDGALDRQKRLITEKFGLNKNTEDMSESELLMHQDMLAEMKAEGREVVDKLKEIGSKVNTVEAPKDPKVESERLEKAKGAWGEATKKLSDDLKFTIPVIKMLENSSFEATGETLKELTFDEHENAQYKTYLDGYIQGQGFPELTKEKIEEAKEVANAFFLYHNFPKIAARLVTDGKAQWEKERLAEKENPSAVKPEVIVDPKVNEDKSGGIISQLR